MLSPSAFAPSLSSSSLSGTKTRYWLKTGRSFGCFSLSSLGLTRSSERSWLKSIPGSNSAPSHRKSTHRWGTQIPPQYHLYHFTHLSNDSINLCASQGCVSCSTATGVVPSPSPPAPDSSCPLESPEQDSAGPVVDTWKTLRPKEPTTELTAKPAEPDSLSTPTVHFFWSMWRNGALCFSVKVSYLCTGVSGRTRPWGTQEASAMGIFTVRQVLQVSLTRLPLMDHISYLSALCLKDSWLLGTDYIVELLDVQFRKRVPVAAPEHEHCIHTPCRMCVTVRCCCCSIRLFSRHSGYGLHSLSTIFVCVVTYYGEQLEDHFEGHWDKDTCAAVFHVQILILWVNCHWSISVYCYSTGWFPLSENLF